MRTMMPICSMRPSIEAKPPSPPIRPWPNSMPSRPAPRKPANMPPRKPGRLKKPPPSGELGAADGRCESAPGWPGCVMLRSIGRAPCDGPVDGGAEKVCAPRRNDLVVPDGNRPPTFGQPQLLQALLHDAHRLAHLFHSHEIAVIAVAVLADRDVEFELGIAFVGLCFAQIPGGTGAAHHHTRKAPTPGLRELDLGDTDVALLEDAIFREQALQVVADLQERVTERPNVVQELRRQILVHAANPEIIGMHACTRRALVKYHQLL